MSNIGDLFIIGESIKAAQEDQASQVRLGAALKANIPAWNGNTAAIEKTIKARMALGFSDDEQRDSLAQIVVATHDVTKALAIQRTAMDLARLKHISLADAGSALIRVEGGQFRALKALGIQLKKGATQTEALAAVQAAAEGQASAYADTNEGKLLASQVKINDAMETLGYTLLPVVASAAEISADAITLVADALDKVFKATKPKEGDFDPANWGWPLGSKGEPDWEKITGDVLGIHTLLSLPWNQKPVMTGFDNIGTHIGKAADDVMASFDDMGGAADDFREKYRDLAGELVRRSGRIRDALAKDAQSMIDSYFNPLETRAQLFDNHLAVLAAADAVRTAKTKVDKQHAAASVIQALDDEATTLVELGTQGALTAKDVAKFAADAKANYKGMSREAIARVNAIIDRLRVLAKMRTISVDVVINTRRTGTHPGGGGPQEFAAGGIVKGPLGSPQLAIVHAGEEVRTPAQQLGADIRVPRTPLMHIAATAPSASVTGAGGTMINNINLPTSARPDPFEVADQLRRMNDFGVLTIGR